MTAAPMAEAQFTFHSFGEDDTERLGQALAEVLAEGGIVALSGPLGAGKTRLVQAIAAAAGVDRRDVVSPTFVLVHEYRGRQPIYHIDAYRLRDADEFQQLGVDDYFCPPNLVLVEWAERVADCLPDDRLEITIGLASGNERQFELAARGKSAAAEIERLKQLVAIDPPQG